MTGHLFSCSVRGERWAPLHVCLSSPPPPPPLGEVDAGGGTLALFPGPSECFTLVTVSLVHFRLLSYSKYKDRTHYIHDQAYNSLRIWGWGLTITRIISAKDTLVPRHMCVLYFVDCSSIMVYDNQRKLQWFPPIQPVSALCMWAWGQGLLS